MKRRTFYVVNLDRGRIFTLCVLTISFLVVAYATGYRMGRKHPEPPDYAQLQPQSDPLRSSVLMQDELRTDVDPSVPPLSGEPAGMSTSLVEGNPGLPESAPRMEAAALAPPAEKRESTTPLPLEEKRNRIGDVVKGKAEVEQAKKEARPAREKKTTRKKEPARKPVAMKNTRSPEKENVGITEKPEGTTFRNTAQGKEAGYHALQIGSYYSEKAASSMSDTLRKQGFHPYVEQSNGKYNVRLGRSTTKEGVGQLEKNLRSKFYDPVHVKIP